MGNARILLALALFAASGCRRRRPPPPAAPLAPVAPQTSAPSPATAEPIDPEDLLPGELVAFGLPLPTATIDRIASSELRMFYVPARMPRVMRYLERRLEFSIADIQPLGAMIRGARLRENDGPIVLDVGVRDEGDRTLVTLWNRTPVVGGPTRTLNEALQAAGYDPQTRRLQHRYNR